MAQNKDVSTTSEGLAPRLAVVDTLDWILRRRRTIDDAMAGSRHMSSVSPDERAFAVFILRTCLQRLGQIDALIDVCLHTPLPRKAAAVRDVMRVGIAQLLFSATAPHAAISTTVELCRTIRQESYVKLVNAVMRRLQREGDGLVAAQDAARLNTPDWLWSSWVAAYGENAARDIALQHLNTAPVDISVKSAPADWAERLDGNVVLGGSVRLESPGDVTQLPGFGDGAWWVQDAAARLPVALLGDVAGKSVYDLCAAPGGKTMELCAAGADVTALDISEKRLARVAENLSRTNLTATLIQSDAREWTPDQPADIVLLDAPCSATGTLRRHPDVAHLKTAADVAKLTGVQDALLDKAADMVAPGGVLLYVTCSLQSDEGPARIARFLADMPGFERQPFDDTEIQGVDGMITAHGDLRTLPSYLGEQGGMDGFYAARLVKTKA